MSRFVLASVIAVALGCRSTSDDAPAAETTAARSDAPAPAPTVVAPIPAPSAVAPSAKPVAPTAPAPVTPPKPERCDPFADLQPRKERDLTVQPLSRDAGGGRFQSYVEGTLTLGDARHWVGPAVPRFVPLYQDDAELFFLEIDGDLVVASYRDPYGAGSCDLRTTRNCDYVVAAFDRCGAAKWKLALNDVMSAKQHLEVGTVEYDDGVLYFSEACQSYAKDAKGKCSALVAVDPTTATVKWRTKPLVARDAVLVDAQYLVSVYDFSMEPAFAYVIRKTDGKILLRQSVESGQWDIRVHEDGHLQLAAFGDAFMHYEMIDWGTDEPKLERIPGYRH